MTRRAKKKIPSKKKTHEDDYPVGSPSNSLYQQSNDEEEYQGSQEEEEEDGASSYIGSESLSSAPTEYNPQSTNSQSKFQTLSQPISQIASYIKIAPLPIFKGTSEECPNAHLSRFFKVCRANNVSSIDMVMRIFPVTLEDEAALWYDLNIEPYYLSLSWDETKSSFLQAYGKVKLADGLKAELMGIKQGENETVRSYFLRLQLVLSMWPEHGLNDGLVKGVFTDGLRGEFKDWIFLQKPNCLNDALRLAFSFEEVRSIRRGGVGKELKQVLNCGFCEEGMHEEKDCEVRKRMKEMWIESKEKKKLGSVNSLDKDDDCDEREKGFVRNDSMGGRRVEEKLETEGGKEEREDMKKNKSQCQCSKHECWKRKLGRSKSLVTGKPHAM